MPSHDEKSVDWEHWKRLDRWELREAVCLLIRVNPDSWLGAQLGRTNPSRDMSSAQHRLWSEGEKINKYAWASYHDAKLRLHVSDWAPATVAAPDWIRWARSKKLDVPPELNDMLPDTGEHAPATRPIT